MLEGYGSENRRRCSAELYDDVSAALVQYRIGKQSRLSPGGLFEISAKEDCKKAGSAVSKGGMGYPGRRLCDALRGRAELQTRPCGKCILGHDEPCKPLYPCDDALFYH